MNQVLHATAAYDSIEYDILVSSVRTALYYVVDVDVRVFVKIFDEEGLKAVVGEELSLIHSVTDDGGQ